MEQTQSRKNDGYGNLISIKNLDELKDFVDISLNKEMWVNGDRIQISNKEGCVINTIVIRDKRLI